MVISSLEMGANQTSQIADARAKDTDDEKRPSHDGSNLGARTNCTDDDRDGHAVGFEEITNGLELLTQ